MGGIVGAAGDVTESAQAVDFVARDQVLGLTHRGVDSPQPRRAAPRRSASIITQLAHAHVQHRITREPHDPNAHPDRHLGIRPDQCAGSGGDGGDVCGGGACGSAATCATLLGGGDDRYQAAPFVAESGLVFVPTTDLAHRRG